MKIVPYDETAYHMDHPKGTVAFNYLLFGDEPENPSNYRYILGRQEGDFHMPRHRHTFEQIRLPLIGDMHLGDQGVLYEGEIGYFPEGQTYGPQDDPLTDPKQLQLVLQFGGQSGLGMKAARAKGKEIKERLIRGENVPTQRARFPRPRYKGVIIADPKNFNWLPVPDNKGVEHKFMGSFSERGLWIEMIKIDAGAEWVSNDPRARRLLVVLSGTATVRDKEIGNLAALQVDATEDLRITATEETELYLIGLPPVELPEVDRDNFDYADVLGSAIQFEDPKDERDVS